jgi:hypothetical protein
MGTHSTGLPKAAQWILGVAAFRLYALGGFRPVAPTDFRLFARADGMT